MQRMIRKAFFLCIIFASLFSISCNKNKEKKTGESVEDTAVYIKKLSQENEAFTKNKVIAVIFGYNFNDSAYIEKTTERLNFYYGIYDKDENPDGLIFPIVFPADFSVSGRTRLSKLNSIIEEHILENGKQPLGILVLGAPEGLNAAIAGLTDFCSLKDITFPVFSFFPQDDILGTEATSDLVLEFVNVAEVFPDIENDVGLNESEASKEDVEYLIIGAINNFISMKEFSAKEMNKNLKATAEKIAGKGKTVSHYTDGETGLLSRNHFVLKHAE